jgi:hypothetical protein
MLPGEEAHPGRRDSLSESGRYPLRPFLFSTGCLLGVWIDQAISPAKGWWGSVNLACMVVVGVTALVTGTLFLWSWAVSHIATEDICQACGEPRDALSHDLPPLWPGCHPEPSAAAGTAPSGPITGDELLDLHEAMGEDGGFSTWLGGAR